MQHALSSESPPAGLPDAVAAAVQLTGFKIGFRTAIILACEPGSSPLRLEQAFVNLRTASRIADEFALDWGPSDWTKPYGKLMAAAR